MFPTFSQIQEPTARETNAPTGSALLPSGVHQVSRLPGVLCNKCGCLGCTPNLHSENLTGEQQQPRRPSPHSAPVVLSPAHTATQRLGQRHQEGSGRPVSPRAGENRAGAGDGQQQHSGARPDQPGQKPLPGHRPISRESRLQVDAHSCIKIKVWFLVFLSAILTMKPLIVGIVPAYIHVIKCSSAET